MRKLFKGIKQCLRWCQQEENSIATITNEGCPSVSKRKAPQTRTTPVHPTAFPRNGRKTTLLQSSASRTCEHVCVARQNCVLPNYKLHRMKQMSSEFTLKHMKFHRSNSKEVSQKRLRISAT
jgi:hypothetical protein